jgi:hypothetical protein
MLRDQATPYERIITDDQEYLKIIDLLKREPLTPQLFQMTTNWPVTLLVYSIDH